MASFEELDSTDDDLARALNNHQLSDVDLGPIDGEQAAGTGDTTLLDGHPDIAFDEPLPALLSEDGGEQILPDAELLIGYEDNSKCEDPNFKQRWNSMISEPAESVVADTEIKRLLEIGVPRRLRSRVWYWLGKRELIKNHHFGLVKPVSNDQYEGYVNEKEAPKVVTLIELDVCRSLSVPFFDDNTPFGKLNQKGLRNILKAYAAYDSEVGYCQGMHLIAAMLLMHSENEHEAFTLFLLLMYGYRMRDIFSDGMAGHKLSQRKMSHILTSEFGELAKHLEAEGLEPPEQIAESWLLTIFTEKYPVSFSVRVFDLVFFGGYDMVFNVIYELLAKNQVVLVTLIGIDELYQYFHKVMPITFPLQFEESVPMILRLNLWDTLRKMECDFKAEMGELLERPCSSGVTYESNAVAENPTNDSSGVESASATQSQVNKVYEQAADMVLSAGSRIAELQPDWAPIREQLTSGIQNLNAKLGSLPNMFSRNPPS